MQQNRPLSVLKKQKRYYSEKKKRRALKTQTLVNLRIEEILCPAFARGKKHDFQPFKDSRVHVGTETLLKADTGYQGLTQPHPHSFLPKKAFQKSFVD